jgi:hypothetical protein
MANYAGNEIYNSSSLDLTFESVNNPRPARDGNVLAVLSSSIVTVEVGTGAAALVPVYRSFVPPSYVYTEGAPAAGFTFTSIVGYK